MKKLKIAVEGVDGVGKSTATEILRKLLESKLGYVPNTVHPLLEDVKPDGVGALVRRMINEKSLDTALLVTTMYLSAVQVASTHIKDITDSLILDRWVMSTYVYALPNDNSILYDDLLTMIDIVEKNIEVPDVYIIITSNQISKNLNKRASESGRSNDDMWADVEKQTTFNDRYVDIYNTAINNDVNNIFLISNDGTIKDLEDKLSDIIETVYSDDWKSLYRNRVSRLMKRVD